MNNKISFIIIVLNGMPFIEYAIKSIYNFAHEIIIVEGAVKKCLFCANENGSSTDGTVEFIKCFSDYDKKIKLIQGSWEEKCEMQNEALEYVSGDYIWLVDSDEIYKKQDIEAILNLINNDPSIGQINFIPNNFWKGFDYIFVSPKFFKPENEYRRIFKFFKGSYFTTHRPPTILHPKYINQDNLKLISGSMTRKMGIIPFHYSYVFDFQVFQKIELYKRYGWEKSWGINLTEWYDNFFLKWTPENKTNLESLYPIWTGDIKSRSEKFEGNHPEIMHEFIHNFKNKILNKTIQKINEKKFLHIIGNLSSMSQTLKTWNYIELDKPLKERFDTIKKSIDNKEPFWNIHVALAFLAKRYDFKTYLEVGVRSGGSFVQALASASIQSAVGIDLWSGEYSGISNTKEFTFKQIKTFLDHTQKKCKITLIQGNSHTELKKLYQEGWRFDLINVDGDHSDEGAFEDLEDSYKLLNPKGIIVFDDIIHPAFNTLLDVARRFAESHSDLNMIYNTTQDNGTAIIFKNIKLEDLAYLPINNTKIFKSNTSTLNTKRKKPKIAGEHSFGKDLSIVDSESKFAKIIKELIRNCKINKVIETGTYHGNGTTKAIASALKYKSEDSTFYTIECNPKNFKIATSNLKQEGLSNHVIPINALSIPRQMLPNLKTIEKEVISEISNIEIFVDHNEKLRTQLYYKETDFNVPDDALNACLKKFEFCPDFVLLDSGGHIGFTEFNYLISMIKSECYIALDDIYHVKHYKSFQAILNDERFTILSHSDEKFGFCVAKFTPYKLNNKDNLLLLVRSDSIGDNIISEPIIKIIHEYFGEPHINLVCQDICKDYYKNNIYVDKIITFNRKIYLNNANYREQIHSEIKKTKYSAALNSIYSRDIVSDSLTLNSGAKKTIAHLGDTHNISIENKIYNNKMYSMLIKSSQPYKLELERHYDFLAGLDIPLTEIHPNLDITKADNTFANNFFSNNNINPRKTIVLFAGAQSKNRYYFDYGKALSSIINKHDYTCIALGSETDFELNELNLKEIHGKSYNLSGKTTLLQAASIINKSRLCIGAETGLAHLSAAVKTPHVVLLGGGHFGRFMPYSKHTSIVCLPLNCFGCNWNCKYQTEFCVKNLNFKVLKFAINYTLNHEKKITRIFLQSTSLWNINKKFPSWANCDKFINNSNVEFIPVVKAMLDDD